MGLNSGIKEYLASEEIKYEDLRGKVIAVDMYNALYQFLASIRTENGDLLTRNGTVVSHLYGILWRYGYLLGRGIKFVFVFDGKPIALKANEISSRQFTKNKNREELQKAIDRGDEEAVKLYKRRIINITEDVLSTAKKLINLLGCDYVEAPAEGEIQAIYLIKNNLADYVATQDYDALLYGSDKIIRNLGVRWKGKPLKPVLIKSTNVFKLMGLNLDKFRRLAFLTGTDYNEGIHGIGIKRGIRLASETSTNEEIVDRLIEDGKVEVENRQSLLNQMSIVLGTIENPLVQSSNINIFKGKFNPEELRKFLLNLNFNIQRFEKIINDISNINNSEEQFQTHIDQSSSP